MKNLVNLALPIYVMGIIITSCSSSQEFNLCNSNAAIHFDSEICLTYENEARFESLKSDIEDVISETLASIIDKMPMDNLLIRVTDNPRYVISEIGIGGFNPNKEEVIISIDPEFATIDNSIQKELAPLLAHEMHHANRRRKVGYGSTLLEAAISEGLADHFAIEVTEVQPPRWSIALQGTELQDWIETASTSWTESPYNHSDWFLGSNPDIPRWVGYSIGFELVRRYMAEDPSRRASDLVGEEAGVFVL